MTTWNVILLSEVELWVLSLSPVDQEKILNALQRLAEGGPNLGRPTVDVIHGSLIKNLKELRITQGNAKHFRLLFVFDPDRKAVVLVDGNKFGAWGKWYKQNIEIAEFRYLKYLDGKLQ